MRRSIVIAIGFAALAGVGCKKGSDSSAKQEPAKTQEGTPAKQDPKASPAAAATDIGVTAGGIQHDDKEGPAGVVTAATGTVEVRRVGETAFAAAKADTKLYAGDTVRTADNSTATITLADESVIEVSEVSTVALASRDGTADPASAAAVLGGVARFTVTPRAPAEGPFRVYASTGVILTRGTVYGVGVSASGAARVGVESGAVDVIGIADFAAPAISVPKAQQVVIAADGKVGAAAAWPADDWGTWRDDSDADVKLDATFDAHTAALTDLNKQLIDGYAELQTNADAAATFEATAATSAEKNDPAAYTAALPDGAATIDASFLLGARLEALTWAYASHAALATDLYVRHPAELEAKWTVVGPQIDAAVLWPKRYDVTATAYFEPLRAQYYVHHPRGRAHAQLVGIAVPQFYAQVEPPEIDPVTVRGKLHGQVWLVPQMTYKVQARPVWVAAPAPSWNANVHAVVAPPRAKVAWYVRPPNLKAKVLVGTNVSGQWKSKLDVQPPQPRAQLAAMWTIPVGMKVKIAPPDLSAAATARAKVKLGADGQLIRDHRVDIAAPSANVKADIKGKVAVPDVKGKVDAKIGVGVPDVKGKIGVNVRDHRDAAVGAGVKAGGDVKAKVGGAVKAGADVKVKIAVPKPPPPPSIKVEGKVKASGGIKIGN
ncbi:MAG TPA: FecR family protein [Kofleriaceae bacterium]|nr:FecR family protein [Kofleriaceae bacterium]